VLQIEILYVRFVNIKLFNILEDGHPTVVIMNNTATTTEDLIIDSAALSVEVKIDDKPGISETHDVYAYPTSSTRKHTNELSATSETNYLKKIAGQCQWRTPGIFQFYLRPDTETVVEHFPKLSKIVIYLQNQISDEAMRQLVAQAKNQYYDLPVEAENFRYCTFPTFLAQLEISVCGMNRKFFGVLENMTQLHPLKVVFKIEDNEDLENVVTQLAEPKKNEFKLHYYYTLSGTSVSNASVSITANQVAQCRLENDLFGESSCNSMIVSRSTIEEKIGEMVKSLKICETIEVGAVELNYDSIMQAIVNSIVTEGFKKYSVAELNEQLKTGTKRISNDLQANITNSFQQSQDHNDHCRQETAHERTTTDLNEIKEHNTHGQHDIKKNSLSGEGSFSGSIPVFGATSELKGKGQKDTTVDISTNNDVRNYVKTDEHRSTSDKNVIDKNQAHVQSSTVTGTKVDAKTIDAAVIDRSRIQNGFNITINRSMHHKSSTCIQGYLSNKNIHLRTNPEIQILINKNKDTLDIVLNNQRLNQYDMALICNALLKDNKVSNNVEVFHC